MSETPCWGDAEETRDRGCSTGLVGNACSREGHRSLKSRGGTGTEVEASPGQWQVHLVPLKQALAQALLQHGCPQRQGGREETQEGLATPAQHGVDAGLGAAAAQLSIPQMRTRNVACQASGLGPASSHPPRHHVCLLHREEPQGDPVLAQVSVPAPPPEREA